MDDERARSAPVPSGANAPLLMRGSVDEPLGGIESGSFLLPSGTVTFLLTDVVGSTRAWERSPESMAKAVSRHYDILAEAIAAHRGARPVEQGEGDSVVGAFSRATDAVAAALAAQVALADEPWPEGAGLQVRMALHAGDAQLRDAFNYFGPVVIRCARIRSLAHGGQIVASTAVHDLADGLPPGAAWRDLGTHRLRDLSRPERLYQLTHPDLAAEFPAIWGLDATPNNLPAQLSAFVGRAEELAATTRLLDTNRLVTLTGAGGCGKTRLALQLAAERVDQHPDGAWYVELASLDDAGAVDRQIADVLGIGDEPDRTLLNSLVAHVGDQRLLLIIDNCEHLLDAIAPVIDRLLRECDRLAVLATSRQPLDIDGEVSWRVPSMSLPAPESPATDVAALSHFDAISLFTERAVRSSADFVVDVDNADGVVEICRRLDGIPLAIELAASRTRQMSVADIEAALDDRFLLLTGGSRTALPRQQTLAASIDWSYDLLDDDHRRVLRLLAVFNASFTLDGATAVTGATPDADVAVRAALGELVDQSLVQLDTVAGETRYRLLETIKAYGRERLRADADEADAARQRHLAFHVELAEQAAPHVQDREDPAWLDRLDHSHDDLRLALHHAHGGLDSEALLRLCAALGPYWHARGHSTEGQEWYERALADAPAAPASAARAAWGSAYLALYATDFELAGVRATEAMGLAESVGDTVTIARSLDTLGTLQQFGDPLGAMAVLHEAADLAEVAGDRWCQIDCLQKLGYSAYYCDRWREAATFGDRARALLQDLDNPFFGVWADVLDGAAAYRTGRLEEATALSGRSLVGARSLGEPLCLLVTGIMRTQMAITTGHDRDAARALEETRADLGDQARGGYYQAVLGAITALVLLRTDDAASAVAGAAATLDRASAALAAEGVAFPTNELLEWRALAHLSARDLSSARVAIDDLEALNAHLCNERSAPMIAYLRALTHRLDERPDLAGESARRALRDWVEAGLPIDATDALELVAGIVGALGNQVDAARLLGAAAAAREQQGWVGRRTRQLDDLFERDLDAARVVLGDRFDDLYAEGRTLELASALELASRARGTRSRPTSGWASLTPTELEVARLVAEGDTNPQIAERLLMSRSTVKTHVSHILTKLDITSRSQIAAELARREDR